MVSHLCGREGGEGGSYIVLIKQRREIPLSGLNSIPRFSSLLIAGKRMWNEVLVLKQVPIEMHLFILQPIPRARFYDPYSLGQLTSTISKNLQLEK